MVRIGKWHEKKILFADDGHAHTGGTDGAHIQAAGLATGCIIQADTTAARIALAHGATTATGPVININTGLTSVSEAFAHPATTGITAQVTATTGATITITSDATATQSVGYRWLALGY
jgi:hypothetical protein